MRSSSLLVVLSVVISSAQPLSALRCAAGFGRAEEREIPPNHINDGYCDCPSNGADEPDTEACAGFEAWAGVVEEAVGV